MAELKKGVLNDKIRENDIDKESLASAEIDGVTGGSGAIWPYDKKSCENKKHDRRRPAAQTLARGGKDGLIYYASDENEELADSLALSENDSDIRRI